MHIRGHVERENHLNTTKFQMKRNHKLNTKEYQKKFKKKKTHLKLNLCLPNYFLFSFFLLAIIDKRIEKLKLQVRIATDKKGNNS